MNSSCSSSFSSRSIGVLLLAAVCSLPVAAHGDTASPLLRPYLTTSRGCLEHGDPATFEIGEDIIIFIGASSAIFDHAKATLYSAKPNGTVAIFGFGSIITNAIYGFVGQVGAPEGIHTL